MRKSFAISALGFSFFANVIGELALAQYLAVLSIAFFVWKLSDEKGS